MNDTICIKKKVFWKDEKYKKIIKRSVPLFLALIMVFSFSTTVFAASGFHKVNGLGAENGGSDSYTSTTWEKCTRITAQGTSDSGYLVVFITIKAPSGDTIIKNKAITLNGTEQSVYNGNLPAGTYTIQVTPKYYNVPYEVSTFFYL